jgi:hypothetical protein
MALAARAQQPTMPVIESGRARPGRSYTVPNHLEYFIGCEGSRQLHAGRPVRDTAPRRPASFPRISDRSFGRRFQAKRGLSAQIPCVLHYATPGLLFLSLSLARGANRSSTPSINGGAALGQNPTSLRPIKRKPQAKAWFQTGECYFTIITAEKASVRSAL